MGTGETCESDLQAFYETGDLDRLVKMLSSRLAGSPEDIRAATLVANAFRPIGNGEWPDFTSVDREAMAVRAAAAILAVEWIAASPKADYSEAAIAMMGVLGWEAFLSRLAGSAFGGANWERVAAIRSLGKMESTTARRMLELLAEDPDGEIAAAAGSALDVE